jgi:hypothetical protein
MLHGGSHGLVCEEMSSSDDGLCADAASDGINGVFTWGITECQAIGIFTYTEDVWTRFFFHHCLAGMPNLDGARKYLTEPGNCWAVIAYLERSKLAEIINTIVDIGVPKIRIILYQASRSRGDLAFGVRLRGGPFGGHFGEIDR